MSKLNEWVLGLGILAIGYDINERHLENDILKLLRNL